MFFEYNGIHNHVNNHKNSDKTYKTPFDSFYFYKKLNLYKF